ncbi:MAG: DegV domain-containing protein [Acidimicrobiia bacterium]|nr:MAG: DegV domain-containing protein [Acidimicrobiia bacterium]
MIALVTDSASMLPDAVRDRYRIGVVPVTVTVDGRDHLEGVDLTADEFYDRVAAGATVATAAPAPGRFLDAYGAARRAGADAVVSIHTGSGYSATAASATVAAGLADLPVHVLDTGAASFPVALATMAAAEAAATGAPVGQVLTAAQWTLDGIGSLFVVGLPALAHRGGRFTSLDGTLTSTTVLRLDGPTLSVHTEAADVDDAIEIIVAATRARAAAGALRVGIGHAALPAVAATLHERLAGDSRIECIPYVVGPSVGAHTGPGTFGVVWAPQ